MNFCSVDEAFTSSFEDTNNFYNNDNIPLYDSQGKFNDNSDKKFDSNKFNKFNKFNNSDGFNKSNNHCKYDIDYYTQYDNSMNSSMINGTDISELKKINSNKNNSSIDTDKLNFDSLSLNSSDLNNSSELSSEYLTPKRKKKIDHNYCINEFLSFLRKNKKIDNDVLYHMNHCGKCKKKMNECVKMNEYIHKKNLENKLKKKMKKNYYPSFDMYNYKFKENDEDKFNKKLLLYFIIGLIILFIFDIILRISLNLNNRKND